MVGEMVVTSAVDGMETLGVGCPMWAHRPWVGRFYPAGIRPGEELAHYASWCNAVEGNTTFYAEPSASTIAAWGEQTDAGFRFLFKLPRTITHEKRLRDVAVEVRSFLDRVAPLGERLGPLQVQLPPSFGPDDLDALGAFLRRLPSDFGWALEVRHRSYFDGSAPHRRLDDWCQQRGIARVILDARCVHAARDQAPATIEEQRNKPNLPVLVESAGSHPVVRVIGEQRPDVTMDALRAWVPQVVHWLEEGRTPHVFVHQPDNVDSPGLARAFHEAVRAERSAVAPLPDPIGQAPLF